jgi:hypothetical protein
MTGLLHFIVLASMLLTATLAGSGFDPGAPDCHSNSANQDLHPAATHGAVPQMRAACDCNCPCCTYVAHLIPLPSTLVFAPPPAPEILYANLQANWFSLSIPPPIRPPKA